MAVSVDPHGHEDRHEDRHRPTQAPSQKAPSQKPPHHFHIPPHAHREVYGFFASCTAASTVGVVDTGGRQRSAEGDRGLRHAWNQFGDEGKIPVLMMRTRERGNAQGH